MRETSYRLQPGCAVEFHNHADECIGTGRMGLALHREYLDQLRLVQEEIGFSHIRGHGLFCDDMAIYQEYKNENGETCAEYNFTYLDRVMDSYREVGLRPFLELGFMPGKMGSGDQTVFYWKGNVTPPKTYEAWRALVQALLRHLLERYGEDALTWPIEVWNEPNLPGFWKGADKEEYFRLFRETLAAVKEVDARFEVGGPAICGVQDVEWMQDFMSFCHENALPLDFVTRHFYTFDTPSEDGRYSYGALRDPDESLKELQVSRDIVDSFPEYRGIPMHITEFNTSYRPDSPVHDTTRNAAYVARLLARLGEVNASYSYWTFGDVFEEMGVPFTPFHGGFGLDGGRPPRRRLRLRRRVESRPGDEGGDGDLLHPARRGRVVPAHEDGRRAEREPAQGLARSRRALEPDRRADEAPARERFPGGRDRARRREGRRGVVHPRARGEFRRLF